MSGRASEEYMEISPADFFYRNRDLAGFTNPSRALYAAIREFVENSLDACEEYRILPDVYVRLLLEEERAEASIYRLKVEDNGPGVSASNIPKAFGKVFFGSKFSLKQTRGKFGLGGTLTILYGQITTQKPARIISSRGGTRIREFELQIDVLNNKPIVLSHKKYSNKRMWHGTVVEIFLEGDYSRAMPKIIEYFEQTAIANPHARLVFVDPYGRLYYFERSTTVIPDPPKEVLPHPYGVDTEVLRRVIASTECATLMDFMVKHFHGVGRVVGRRFLEYADIPASKNPKELTQDEVVKLAQAMRSFDGFKNPDSDCLSTLGKESIIAGIKRRFDPEFIAVDIRRPSAYSGFPFKVEVALAYGGNVPRSQHGLLYRFANRIPLLYDEHSDVSWKVMQMIDWKSYNIALEGSPIAVFVYLFSTKIPYKTVGKEYIADRPEIEKEILNGLRKVCRSLRAYLSRRERIKHRKRRLDLYSEYLPKIARFSAELAGKEEVPDIKRLLEQV